MVPKRLVARWQAKTGHTEKKYFSFSFKRISKELQLRKRFMLTCIKYAFDNCTGDDLLDMLVKSNLHINSSQEGRKKFAQDCVRMYRDEHPNMQRAGTRGLAPQKLPQKVPKASGFAPPKTSSSSAG